MGDVRGGEGSLDGNKVGDDRGGVGTGEGEGGGEDGGGEHLGKKVRWVGKGREGEGRENGRLESG